MRLGAPTASMSVPPLPVAPGRTAALVSVTDAPKSTVRRQRYSAGLAGVGSGS